MELSFFTFKMRQTKVLQAGNVLPASRADGIHVEVEANA
jgi:hypothetical protein